MKDIRQEIDEWIYEIDELANRIKDRSSEWWWLDNGNRPFIKVNIVKVEYKRRFPLFWKKKAIPKFLLSDLLSLYGALLIIKENLEKSKDFDLLSLVKTIQKVNEDITSVHLAIKAAKEAHEYIEELSSLLEKAQQTNKDLAREIRALINSIMDLVVSDYKNWEKRKDTIEKKLEQIRRTLKVAKVKVPAKEEEKEVEEITAKEKGEEEVELA